MLAKQIKCTFYPVVMVGSRNKVSKAFIKKFHEEAKLTYA
jgi:hypothetical protein